MKYAFAFAAVIAMGHMPAGGAPLATLSMVNGDDSGPGLPFNTTEFILTNASSGGTEITGMSLTVGDLAYNFDQVYESRELFSNGNGSQQATLVLGDRFQDGAVTDAFAYSFVNFAPFVSFRGQFDIDQDNGAFEADARLVLFNNGASPNALWTVNFSDGTNASLLLPDGSATADSYTFTIPEPAAVVLLAAGLLWGRCRRRC